MKNLHVIAALPRKSLARGLAAALALGTATLAEAAQPVLAGALIDRAADMHLAPGLDKLRQARTAAPRSGTVHLVTNCNDAGPGSLREAIAGAAEGDRIDLASLACSTISLSTGAIQVPQADLEIAGPGKDALLVDAQNSDRAFYVAAKYQESHGVAISGVTVANGRAKAGGCVLARGNLHLRDVRVRDCQAKGIGTEAPLGGGVSALGSILLQDSIVSGNRVTAADGDALGGGLSSLKYIYSMDSTIENNTASTIRGNAGGGGAVAQGTLARHSMVSGNRAESGSGNVQGGGLFAMGTSEADGADRMFMYLYQTVLSDNQALSANGKVHGGGGRVGDMTDHSAPREGSAFLAISTISGNEAKAGCISCTIIGGGISASGNIVSYYSTISDNEVRLPNVATGTAGGGGLGTTLYGWPAMGSIRLMQSTVSGNRAIAVVAMAPVAVSWYPTSRSASMPRRSPTTMPRRWPVACTPDGARRRSWTVPSSPATPRLLGPTLAPASTAAAPRSSMAPTI